MGAKAFNQYRGFGWSKKEREGGIKYYITSGNRNYQHDTQTTPRRSARTPPIACMCMCSSKCTPTIRRWVNYLSHTNIHYNRTVCNQPNKIADNLPGRVECSPHTHTTSTSIREFSDSQCVRSRVRHHIDSLDIFRGRAIRATRSTRGGGCT